MRPPRCLATPAATIGLTAVLVTGCGATRSQRPVLEELRAATSVQAWGTEDTLVMQVDLDGAPAWLVAREDDVFAFDADDPSLFQAEAIAVEEHDARRILEEANALTVAPAGTLDRLVADALAGVLPTEPGTGLEVVGETQSSFVLPNAGDYIALPSAPAGFRTTATLRLKEVFDRIYDAVEDWKRTHAIDDEFVLFFGSSETGSTIALLVDSTKRDAVSITYRGRTKDGAPEPVPGIASTATVAGVVLRSHTLEILVHPYTSLRNLLVFGLDWGSGTDRLTQVRYDEYPALANVPIPPLVEVPEDGPPPTLVGASWDEWLDEHTQVPATPGTIELLVGGEAYFPRLEEAIADARESIHLRTYIFDNDEFALGIADDLAARAAEIDVRVIVDGQGTAGAAGGTTEGGTAVTGWMVGHLRSVDVPVRQVPNTWFAGDHSKCTVIDGERAFVGGMNIGREYFYDWHDLMSELRGPIVARLSTLFNKSWVFSSWTGDFGAPFYSRVPVPDPADDVRTYPIRIVLSSAVTREIYNTHIEAARRAKRRIWIENAYFTEESVVYELCAARKRGVDVRVILPIGGDNEIINSKHVVVVNRLLENGCRVYVYPRMTHMKAALFDDWAIYGSANLQRLSFRWNGELDIACDDPEFIQTYARDVFETDFGTAFELTEPLEEGWFEGLAADLGNFM